MWARFFPHFLRDRSFKSRQNPRVDFFSGKKRPRRIQNGVFPFTVVEFCGRWIVYNSRLNSPRRGRFVNSAFPSKKNLAQQRNLFMTNKFESKYLQKFYVSSKHEKECYIENDVLPRGTESPFLSALHAKNDTTNLFGYKLGESTENNKALLFFSGKETIQTCSGSTEVITLLFAK